MRFVLIAPDNLSGNAQSAMQSVRRGVELLTEKQAAAIKPQRLRVVTVQAGDTLDTLSRYMTTGDDRRQDLFLALNNLKKPANLTPGMRLKLVVD